MAGKAKLLLVEDVPHLGRKGELVQAQAGFARNFLLPQKLAVIADKQALRMQEKLQEERKLKANEDAKESQEIAARCEGLTLTTLVKVDHEGHMYGSVSVNDIVDLLKNEANLTIDKHHIHLKHPIKEIGVHTISLKLKEGVTASFTLKVISEEALIDTVVPTDT